MQLIPKTSDNVTDICVHPYLSAAKGAVVRS